MKRKIFIGITVLLLIGLLVPQQMVMPVKGADRKSYNQQSFWYYPWGKSITHKGVDIFAKEGTTLMSATQGIVVFTGTLGRGGKVVVVLGPKWRCHYYAHLNEVETGIFSLVKPGSAIGTVGTTGNAKGKPPHLHYSIVTIIPYLWRIDSAEQGWMKMFFLNPIEYLNEVGY